MLTRFWISFAKAQEFPPVATSCGVTARSLDDALNLLLDKLFKGLEFEIVNVVVNVDVSKIDDPHVRFAMGNPAVRGIWYPVGYD